MLRFDQSFALKTSSGFAGGVGDPTHALLNTDPQVLSSFDSLKSHSAADVH